MYGGIKMEMDREEAIEYLKRKGKDVTEKNIKKVMSKGSIFGDPLVRTNW